jgi:uncharacterized protein
LKILLILAAILLLVRFRVALSINLLCSAVVLGLLFNLPLKKIGECSFRGATDPETLLLTASLLLILIFSGIMKEMGMLARAVTALRGIFRDPRVIVAIIPAIMGILPIMGGAMLSAPLVSEVSEELKLSPERKTFLNYWFRHIWEFMLPTYPAVLLTATLVGTPVAKICLMALPLTIASIGAGIFLGFPGATPALRHSVPSTRRQTLANAGSFLGNLLPFFLILLLTLGLKIHLAYSLASVTVATVLYLRLRPPMVWRLVKENFSWEIVFLIWGIMIFKEILLAGGAMNSVARELSQMGMPPIVLVISLPFILGMITGYANALIGLGFPILLPFFQLHTPGFHYLMLAYVSGFSAVFLSPMHVCLVMTQEFFQADMKKVYRLLIPPVAIFFLTGAAVALASFWFSGR